MDTPSMTANVSPPETDRAMLTEAALSPFTSVLQEDTRNTLAVLVSKLTSAAGY
jgi:hypothetical protein